MSFEPASLWAWILLSIGLPLFVLGGLRFRGWAVEGRPGVPRYSRHLETIFLWLVYSGSISITIVIVKQAMRRLG